MLFNDDKLKRQNKLSSFVLTVQILGGVVLLVFGIISTVWFCLFYDSEAVDKATEKLVQELSDCGCVYYTEGRYGTGLEFVCPAENDSLEIIDFGSNLKPTDSIHDRKEQAHKYGYSYKEWNGLELVEKE